MRRKFVVDSSCASIDEAWELQPFSSAQAKQEAIVAKANKKKSNQHGVVKDEPRDEANKRRFVDQSGLAAQDLPEASHGQNVVDPPEEMTRNLPQQHGGEMPDAENYDEGGLRGSRDISAADDRGGRKHN
jgi:hypothetical protein